MKKIIICCVIVLWTRGVVWAAPARDVLAHASGDWTWFAHVSRDGVENPLANSPVEERTEAFVRQNGPGQGWQPLPPVIGRATAMASRSSQLVLLMSDGQWITVWSDGSATGQPLPADGRILTLADDGDNLWAIGAVPGGRAAADEAILQELASTHPTTAPAMPISAAQAGSSLEPATTQSVPESSLVVFRQSQGRWKTFAELPRDASLLSDGAVSMVVVGGSPVISYKVGKGAIKSSRWDADRQWTPVESMDAREGSIDDFKLFTDGSRPLLWWTRGISPGSLVFDSGSEAPPIKLEWRGTNSLEGLPAVTFAGGFIRVLGPHGNRIFEQRYEGRGEPVAVAAELMVPSEGNAASMMEVIEAIFLIAVAFSVGASVYRQWIQSQTPAQAEPPTAAPLLPRLGAGLIDLIPVFVAMGYLYMGTTGELESGYVPSQAVVELCAGAVVVYLLHTTVVELLTGRTPGKWVCGLKVVTTEGQQPGSGQIVIRNLLRLVDPLVMILISPLRQRSADVVAGTMVVRADETQPKAADVDSEPDPAEKDPRE